jgi:far upstream element-binding protein
MSDSPSSEQDKSSGNYLTADLNFEPDTTTNHKRSREGEDKEDYTNGIKKNKSEDTGQKNSDTSPTEDISPASFDYLSPHAYEMNSIPNNTFITEIHELTPEKVGQVIGSKGAIIQDMQTKTGCKIQVNQDFPMGVNRQIIYTGTPAQVAAAKELVALIIERGPTAIHMLNGPVVTQIIECAQPLVGRVIGSGGSTIRDIQARCGVKIQVHQDMPEHIPRKIEITGNSQAVQMAAACIRQIIEGISGVAVTSGGMPTMNTVSSGSGGIHVIECAKQYVGRIIGRGGETINVLQAKSGARVQIDQKVPDGMPCKVNISGTPECVNLAIQMVQEIISNGPNRLALYPNYQTPYNAAMSVMGQMQYGGGSYYGAPMGMGFTGGAMYATGTPQMAVTSGYYGPASTGGYGGYGTNASGYAQPYSNQGNVGYTQPTTAATAAAAGQGYQTQSTTKPTTSSNPWSEHKTDDGISYWYNSQTGVSQWERPNM